MRALKNIFGCLCVSTLFAAACLGQEAAAPVQSQAGAAAPPGVGSRPETICLSAKNNEVAPARVPVYLSSIHRVGEQSFDLVACYEADTEEARARGDLLIELVVRGTDAAPVMLKRPAVKVGEETLCRTDRSTRQFESAAGNVTAAVISQTIIAADFEQLFTGRPVSVQYGRLTFELKQDGLDALRKLLKLKQQL